MLYLEKPQRAGSDRSRPLGAKAELAYTTTSIIDKNVNAQPSSCCRIPLR